MNTQQLQKDFPEVYEEFFAENEIVLSCPLLVTRCGDYMEGYEGVSIKQKIPLRVYVGFKSAPSRSIILHKLFYRKNSINREFVRTTIKSQRTAHTYFEEKLNEHLQNISYNVGGYISLLMEVPTGSGIGVTSGFFLLLSILLLEINQKRILKELNKITSLDICLNKENTSLSPTKEILDFTTQLMKLYDSKILLNSFYPICNYLTTVTHSSLPYIFTVHSSGTIEAFLLDKLLRHIDRLDTGIDYMIVHSGISFWAGFLIDNYTEYLHEKRLTSQNLIGIETLNLKDLNEIESIYHNSSNQLLKIFSYDILNIFIDTYKKRSSQSTFSLLSDRLNKFSELQMSIKPRIDEYQEKWTKLNFLIHGINERIRLFSSENCGSGGIIGITIPPCSDDIKKLLLRTCEDNGFGVLYFSSLDGSENKGLLVEQHLSQKILSNHFPYNKAILSTSNNEKSYIDVSKIHEIEADILLDLYNQKFVIKGQPLTSKDLPSQSFTVDLLALLLKAPNHKIENTLLPPSSYSKNKNDMVGKIIGPLKNITEKYFGMPIKISCTGSLTSYIIELGETDMDIKVVSYASVII